MDDNGIIKAVNLSSNKQKTYFILIVSSILIISILILMLIKPLISSDVQSDYLYEPKENERIRINYNSDNDRYQDGREICPNYTYKIISYEIIAEMVTIICQIKSNERITKYIVSQTAITIRIYPIVTQTNIRKEYN